MSTIKDVDGIAPPVSHRKTPAEKTGSAPLCPADSTEVGSCEVLENPAPELCAEGVMDTVPLVMRFIRSHVQGDETDLPSISQLRVLSCLTATPGSTLSDVARYINVTKATASTMVARMVDRGLVERLDDPNERRCVILNATPEGKAIYRIARNNAQQSVAAVLAKLSNEEQEKISEGLALLREAFLR